MSCDKIALHLLIFYTASWENKRVRH